MKAILAFEDGTVFRGKGFGARKTTVGEAVFNTSEFGYEELLTDPSAHKNIVVMTFSEIGCYGITTEDCESCGVKAAGLVVAQECRTPSNWRSKKSLPDFLAENGTPAISGVDTRAITVKIRQNGTLKACLSTEDISDEDAVRRAREWRGLDGADSAGEVSCKTPWHFDTEKIDIEPFKLGGVHINNKTRTEPLFKCAVLDFGAPLSMLKSLAFCGFDLTVFPSDTSAAEILAASPDCLFLSSGAGDPAGAITAQKTVAELAKKLPTMGVGFGHQILALAFGGKTYKLKFGHHGENHPSQNTQTKTAKITTQNHTYAVAANSLANTGLKVSEVNLTDGTVEALRHESLPVFSVQYRPEPAPGSLGSEYEFDTFYKLVKSAKKA